MAEQLDLAALGANAPPSKLSLSRLGQTLLDETTIGRMIKGMADAVMTPGRILHEGYRPTPEQEADSALNAAGLAMTGGLPFAGAANELRTGMSMPLFHGSSKQGLSEILPSQRGALGPGAYFTPAENVAARYGENVYQLPERERQIFNGLGDRYGSYADWKADKQKLLNAVEPDKKAELEAILEKMWTNDGYPMHSRIAQMYRDEGMAQDLYKRAGFEGFAGHADGPEVVLFDKQSLR